MSDSDETKYLRRRVDESCTARGLAEGDGARHSHASMRNEYQKRLNASAEADFADQGHEEGVELPSEEQISRPHARWENEGGQG